MKKFNLLILSMLMFGCSTNNSSSEASSISSQEEIVSSTISSSESSSINEISSFESTSSIIESSTEERKLVTVKYKNPVYDADFADPSYVKCEEDGYYYLFATGAKIIKTKDMVNYEYVGTAFKSKPTWSTSGANVWAPDVQYVDGQYVMYYSLSKWDDPNPGIGIATAPHPAGPWEDKGKLFRSSEIGVNNSIDAMVYQEDGRVYMVWGSFSANPFDSSSTK